MRFPFLCENTQAESGQCFARKRPRFSNAPRASSFSGTARRLPFLVSRPSRRSTFAFKSTRSQESLSSSLFRQPVFSASRPPACNRGILAPRAHLPMHGLPSCLNIAFRDAYCTAMNWRKSLLVIPLVVYAHSGFSQGTVDDAMRRLEEQRRQTEMEINRARIRSLEFEADIARMRAETERIKAETERMEADRDARTAADEATRQQEAARISAQKAEDAADEMRTAMILAGVKTRNSVYLLGLAAAVVGFGVYVIKSKRSGVPMARNEKFGLVAIIVSFLLSLFFLMISSNWSHAVDLLTNLMVTLQIELFLGEEKYLIDFPTKYAILACLVSAAYGVTTYLGITPVPWKEDTNAQQPPSEPAKE